MFGVIFNKFKRIASANRDANKVLMKVFMHHTHNNVCASNRMDIYWNLLRVCNQHCSTCPILPTPSSPILTRDRLLSIADRIAQIQGQQVSVILGGGEPTLHPFLGDILTALRRGGNNLDVVLRTNGTQAALWYVSLLEGIQPDRITLDIYLHADAMPLINSLDLIGTLGERGLRVCVNVVEKQHDSLAWQRLYAALQNLSASLHFSLQHGALEHLIPAWRGTVSSCGLESPFSSNVVQPISEPEQIVILDDNEDAMLLNRPRFQLERYCSAAVNYIRIEQDGTFFLTPCHQEQGALPLWQEDIDVFAKLPRIIKCRQIMILPPKTMPLKS